MPSNLEERLMQAKERLRLKSKLESMLQQAQKAVREEERAQRSVHGDNGFSPGSIVAFHTSHSTIS